MDLSNLQPAPGSTKNRKRIGRGPGSGKGGTSTRGSKGAKSRSGYKHKIGFEGGQMPLQRRLPKWGFKNPFRVEYKVISLGDIDALAQAKNLEKVTVEDMIAGGLTKSKNLVKVLLNGEITRPLEIVANAFSASAIKAIEAAGGKATKL